MPEQPTHKVAEPKRLQAKKEIIKILRTVPYEQGFHFHTAPEQFTRETATSMEEFEKKLQTVPVESVVFHFLRKDFQNWIKGTLGDNELAKRINGLDKALPDEKLRKEIIAFVQTRIAELKRELPHSLRHNHS